MLALVLTLILALYILGPDLFSRVIVGMFAPARPRNKNKSEEITRAILLSAIPVLLVWAIMHYGFRRFSDYSVLHDFMLGLYGEQSLDKHSDAFYSAARTVVHVNTLFLLIPIYTLVLLWSIFLGCLIRNYGRLLRHYENAKLKTNVLSWLVRPWVADWHLKLSHALLPRKSDFIRVDVLTKMDVLYRGTLIEHHLGTDGDLVSMTLREPKRYKRKELLEARRARPAGNVDTTKFWTNIEAHFFIILAAEIVTVNLVYIDPESLKKPPTKISAKGAGRALAAAKRAKATPKRTSPSRGSNARA